MDSSRSKRKVIYRITYPNGKIYIGKDLTDSATYFGSVNAEIVRADFTQAELDDFTIRKQVVWSSEEATDSEVNQAEVWLIRENGSNNPAIGYNRWPKYKP